MSNNLYATAGGGNGGGGGGGGGPAFSNGAPGSNSECGSASISNSGAGVAKGCHPDDYDFDTYCFSVMEDCEYASKGALCEISTCTCWGSMENNIWSQFCAPATGTYDFEVTNVVCSGGGSSLQFFVAPTPASWSSVCDLTAEYCNKGSTGDKTHSVDMVSGECYTLMFDGNAGADCTWDFNINCSVVLGLTMIDYSAELSEDQTEAEISWDIVDEYNVDYYKILKSTNGANYKEIGKVYSKNIGEVRYKYTFADNNPNNGTNYYKLIQVEETGKEYKYKPLIVTKTKSKIELYPNPITSDLNINFGNELSPDTEITIYDVLGNLVQSTKLETRSVAFKIDMSNQEKGMYFLFIRDGESLIQQKFYKD